MNNKFLRFFSAALAIITVFSCSGLCFTVFSDNSYAAGDTVTFGSYPQTKVTDEETLEKLNSLVAEDDFIDMNYYIGDGNPGSEKLESYYFYCDKTYDGTKYRAVYFTKYRPTSTYASCPDENSNMYTARGYYKNNIYWFRFDPIEWKILDPTSGLIISTKLLDAQPYNNTFDTVSDFSQSTLRTFLNDSFYNLAFTANEKSAITAEGDKLTLLTKEQAQNADYGFTTPDSRKSGTTDYGVIGGNVPTIVDGIPNSNWLLKDKYNERFIEIVYYFGTFSNCHMNSVRGVRPVTNIDLSEANKFNIAYKVNGSLIKEEEYEAGEAVTPYSPEIEGYTFNGWDTEIPATMPARSIEANALVTINSYNLTADANGGKFADETEIRQMQAEYNSPIILEEPTRAGYIFDGWDNAAQTMPAEDLTFTALWAESEDTPYKITIYKENLNGGYDADSETHQGRTNRTVTLNPDVIDGYDLDSERSVLTCKIAPDGTSELKIYYNLKTYNLTFNFGGEAEEITQTYKHGQAINPPKIPKRTGFAGKWDKDIPDICTSSDTYGVIWLEDSFQISFNTDGGSNINNAVYKYGSPVTKPENPVKEGYTFIGWDKDIPDTMPAENLEFTALWLVNTYKIKWIANGEEKAEAVAFGEKIKEPIVIENDGYSFTGWDKAIPSTMPAEDLIFTAVFTEKEFSVTWVAGGTTLKRETYKYGEEITEPTAPERTGFTFAWDNHPETMPAKDITITGTYKEITSADIIPEIRIINYKSVITVDYKTTITFRSQVKNSASKNIKWYVNNEYKGFGDTFTVNQAKDTFNIRCVAESSTGNKVSSETELVKVKTDFWSRIVAFFRMLFRRLPVITQ